MSGSARSGAIENQIVNALAFGRVVYAAPHRRHHLGGRAG